MGLFGRLLRGLIESPEERTERYQRQIDEWDRREAEEALEEEYDEEDGIEDADY